MHARSEHHAHRWHDSLEAGQAGARQPAADLAEVRKDIVRGLHKTLVLDAAGIGLRQRTQKRHVGDADAMGAEDCADDVFRFDSRRARKQPR